LANPGHSSIWQHAWQSSHELGLQNHHIPIWEAYLGALSNAHIHLQYRMHIFIYKIGRMNFAGQGILPDFTLQK
jgi:hypothetical protein